MKGAVIRFLVVLILFLGWLGYLGFLVRLTPRKPVILSRPQFLVADLVVVARIDDQNKVVVEKPIAGAGDDLVGKAIRVTNIDACMPPLHLQEKEGVRDFTGPGSYILALRKVGENYEVVPTPPAPGFPAPGVPRPGPPRIYPATSYTLAQLKKMPLP